VNYLAILKLTCLELSVYVVDKVILVVGVLVVLPLLILEVDNVNLGLLLGSQKLVSLLGGPVDINCVWDALVVLVGISSAFNF